MATPLFLSPALPSELVWFIVHHCSHPTTLLICSSREDFLSSTVQQMQTQAGSSPEGSHPDPKATQLVATPLYQVAVARHIRVAFIPTVSHLRAFLSIFSVANSKVSAPPPSANGATASPKAPLLLLYGFLDLHRDTSEWSVQGVSNTAAVLVEAATRVGFQAVVVEPQPNGSDSEGLLTERMPILSGSARRTGAGLEGNGWTGKTGDVRRVLGRWFRFQPGEWERDKADSNP
ncbi:hypothetical protein OQA88_11051 [Cercophora sp. LCS_1]